MKSINIYIDHYAANEDIKFSETLRKRLNLIEGVIVRTYYEISENDHINDEDSWVKPTAKAINSSTIVIPILSADYLGYVKEIEKHLNKITDSKDRFLFPILLKSCDWSSQKWVLQNKIIPEDGKPLLEYSSNDVDRIINDLIKNIESIVNQDASTTGKPKIENMAMTKSDKAVFISHNHSDADFAELLKLKLEKSGLKGWIDTERLKIGQDWREEIDNGIEDSVALIVIMTPEARMSEYVTYEWSFAWGKGKKIYPIMLKQTSLHPRLESLQYIDFTNRASRPWEELVNSIQELIKA